MIAESMTPVIRLAVCRKLLPCVAAMYYIASYFFMCYVVGVIAQVPLHRHDLTRPSSDHHAEVSPRSPTSGGCTDDDVDGRGEGSRRPLYGTTSAERSEMTNVTARPPLPLCTSTSPSQRRTTSSGST